MKKFFLLLATFLLSISSAFADRPNVYCKLDKQTSNFITLFSKISYNGRGNLPASFITGNDRLVTKDFTLGNNNVKFKLYFPKQENGRALNATTTVHVTIYLNGKEIVNTKHFGQPSDYFVRYQTDILCRANTIYVALDRNNKVRVRLLGRYTPKHVRENNYSWGEEDESRFELDYLASSGLVNDMRMIKSVMANTDKPNGLPKTNNKNGKNAEPTSNASTKEKPKPKNPKKPKKKHGKKEK